MWRDPYTFLGAFSRAPLIHMVGTGSRKRYVRGQCTLNVWVWLREGRPGTSLSEPQVDLGIE